MNAHLSLLDDSEIIAELIAKLDLFNRVLEAQKNDEKISAIVNQSREGKETKFIVNDDGFVYYIDWVCVPNDDELKKSIHKKAHSGSFVMHLYSTKMYQDLKTSYCWFGMKRDVTEFVTKCMVCEKVKVEHQVPSGLLQPIKIPEWKWDRITMDFVVGLPVIGRKHDSVLVGVDQLTKSAYFIPMRTDYSLDKLEKLYLRK